MSNPPQYFWPVDESIRPWVVGAISIPLFPEVEINTVAVPIPQVRKGEVQTEMLSAQERVIIGRFAGVSETAFIGAREKRGVDGSEPFPGVGDPERFIPVFEPIDDGRGGRRAEPVDTIDPAIKREGLAPARLDGRDGESDPLADAMQHQLAVDHDDPDVDARICSGQGCEKDHVREAYEALHRHMALREALPSSHGMVKFQR